MTHHPCPYCGTLPDAREDIPTLELGGLEKAATLALPRSESRRAGDLYAERFRIARLLGKGGMGAVYLVEEIATGKVRALKTLKPALLAEPSAVERFRREIGLLQKLDHPAVPKVFAWGTFEAEAFYVGEFISGQDLAELIRQRGALPCQEAVSIIATVAEALGAAHELGVVHRDVKPQNIMITPLGQPYLIDFGVARVTGNDVKTITTQGAMIGTPQYMSPEQIDSHRVDERSDIYSLGVVLFEVLTGELPFVGDTPMSIANKHLHSPPPEPREINSEIPYWLQQVILRCLEKEPASRFWTTQELVAELRRPHRASVRKRTFDNGDTVALDLDGLTPWALTIESPRSKDGWKKGIALSYEGHFYRLAEARGPGGDEKDWSYRCTAWPDDEILRGVEVYEPRHEVAVTSVAGRLKKWLGR